MRLLKVVWERVYRDGYVLRRELHESACTGHPPFEMTSAYNPRGEYIGRPREAWLLCVKRGIQPEKRDPNHSVCSIGFSVKNGKWYGWSHRAIFGFKKGSVCRKGMIHYRPRSEGGRGAWRAKNLADARQMACDFAAGCS